jgi:hypothetical protein
MTQGYRSRSSRRSSRSSSREEAASTSSPPAKDAEEDNTVGADGLVKSKIKASAQIWFTPDQIRQHSHVEVVQSTGRSVIGYVTRARVDGSFDVRFSNGHIEKTVGKERVKISSSALWYQARNTGGMFHEVQMIMLYRLLACCVFTSPYPSPPRFTFSPRGHSCR